MRDTTTVQCPELEKEIELFLQTFTGRHIHQIQLRVVQKLLAFRHIEDAQRFLLAFHDSSKKIEQLLTRLAPASHYPELSDIKKVILAGGHNAYSVKYGDKTHAIPQQRVFYVPLSDSQCSALTFINVWYYGGRHDRCVPFANFMYDIDESLAYLSSLVPVGIDDVTCVEAGTPSRHAGSSAFFQSAAAGHDASGPSSEMPPAPEASTSSSPSPM